MGSFHMLHVYMEKGSSHDQMVKETTDGLGKDIYHDSWGEEVWVPWPLAQYSYSKVPDISKPISQAQA